MKTEQQYQQYMYSYPHKTAYGTLQDVDLRDYVEALSEGENSLYFHIPFCQYKCGYCNLFSVTGQSQDTMSTYVAAMRRQAEQLSEIIPEGVEFTDLTLGGGTPLILPEPLLNRIFGIAEQYFSFNLKKYPVVAETSPNQTTEEKLALLKEKGVTRVSIGVQSFQPEELSVLHRHHTAETARKALQRIKETGFDCMNMDIIYGIPGQTADSLRDSLRQALEYEPEELFVYPLYVKPETALYRQGVKQSEITPSLYECARDFLREEGYQQHSMRRFVKAGDGGGDRLPASLCGFGNTISVGCGGRSYIGRLHFCTPYAVRQEHCLSIIKSYMEQENYRRVTHGCILSWEEQKRRYVIKHILFGRGIDRLDYRRHFGAEAQADFPMLQEWEQAGCITIGEEFLSLTEKGFALSDYLGPQLISPEVRRRSENFYKGLSTIS